MADIVEKFITHVSNQSELQRKYLQKWNITEKEKVELRIILSFFLEKYNYTLDYLADAYIFINNMVMEETYYFIKYGKYRNESFEEVNKEIYQNTKYMDRLMCGLTISDYIWINHIKMIRYYEKHLDSFRGKKYLEIGPGFGQYLKMSILKDNFDEYLAVDISPVSVKKCRDYLEYCGIKIDKKCNIIEKNFENLTINDKFDFVVMGEMLEHVEKPLNVLNKIYTLLNQNGKAFITTVINAPTIDHIFLFKTVKDVLDIVRNAGFKIEDYFCATAGDISFEKAEKKKKGINIALILKKQTI